MEALHFSEKDDNMYIIDAVFVKYARDMTMQY